MSSLVIWLPFILHLFNLWIGNLRQKNNSAEDEIDRTIGLFRWNSCCSAEKKTLGILFRIIPQRRKKARNSVPWRKIEANSRNSVTNHSVEEKPTRNSVPWNKQRSKLSEFRSEAYLGQKHTVKSVWWSRIFCKANFFHVLPFRSELRNWLFCKPRNASEWPLSSTE